MRGILFKGDGKIAHVSIPDPVPGPGEVVVKMHSSGICGSDLNRMMLPGGSLGASKSVVPGHEVSGAVVAVGQAVATVKTGDRVLGYFKIGCLNCAFCREGAFVHCPQLQSVGTDRHGSDAEYVVLPEWAALPLPDWMSYAEGAVLVCNFGTAYSALHRSISDRPASRTVAILGAGPVGLAATMIAAARGLNPVVVDPSNKRQGLAKRLGAVRTYSPDDDISSAFEEVTKGSGVDIVLETSGSGSAQALAIQLASRLGEVVLVGNGALTAEAQLSLVKNREIVLRGSIIYRLREYEPMLDFIERRGLSLARLVGETFSIDEAEEAFALARRRTAAKVLFQWS